MDVLIKNDEIEVTFSSMGLLLTDFDDSSPSLVLNRRSVRNRNGYINYGAVHSQKNITLTGVFLARDPYELEVIKDEINGLISNDEPFYITKMIPTREIYEYQNPGETTGFDLLEIPHTKYRYRYKVITENSIQYDFLGNHKGGLLTRFSISLITADIPYGLTEPTDESINHYIYYEGTAKCSQLEHPWSIKLVAGENQPGDFSVSIGGKVFTHRSVNEIKKGDTFILKGVETLYNGKNVNVRTNYVHFVLTPKNKGLNEFSTNFKGSYEILNKVEFYI